MSEPQPETLSLSRQVLRVLVGLNFLVGFLILALLIASVVAEGPIMRGLGVRDGDGREAVIQAGRSIMLIGIVAVPVTHIVLTQLLAMVDTVRVGDPFVAENAVRLQRIAWAVLGMEVLHLSVGFFAGRAASETQPFDIDWNFSVARWLTVLLLFVLARVFEQGTRMREDLEGTV